MLWVRAAEHASRSLVIRFALRHIRRASSPTNGTRMSDAPIKRSAASQSGGDKVNATLLAINDPLQISANRVPVKMPIRGKDES